MEDETRTVRTMALQTAQRNVRIIPRLDIKGPNVVKGIQLEGLRVVGDPVALAKRYYEQGADELLYIDIVASLYERNSLLDIVEKTTSSGIFIPVTVGGGIRTIEDVRAMLRAGADKVAINTAATRNPSIIMQAAQIFGKQCIVGSIEAKRQGDHWEAYIDNGRERTGLDAIAWAKRLVELGAGELLVTSVDRDGTRKGMDLELLRQVSDAVDVPVIACGGIGNLTHLQACVEQTGCDAVAFGTLLHYNEATIGAAKQAAIVAGALVRGTDGNIPEFATAHARTRRRTVSIIDYQVGNLRSVVNGFAALGCDVKIISTPDEVAAAELLVLPGDGAFGYAMEQLRRQRLIEPLRAYAASGKPLLGICLGMQLLVDTSAEFGTHEGLGLIPGEVVMFTAPSEVAEAGYVLPQMGWNAIARPAHADWSESIFRTLPECGAEVYFIHSFHVRPKDRSAVAIEAVYGGQRFAAAIRSGNVYGVQFHPEKSGVAGMRIIEEFSGL